MILESKIVWVAWYDLCSKYKTKCEKKKGKNKKNGVVRVI